MIRRALLALTVGLAALPAHANAQRDSIVARVRGVVFDSIHNRPLSDAFVAIVGGSISTQTDERGRFQFDSVARGMHTVVVQHPSLDSLGFPGLLQRVRFTATEEAHIATPSFATLWKRMCGDRLVSEDSGLVYGIVRDAASNRPILDAIVSVIWRDSLRHMSSSFVRSEAAMQAEEFEANRRRKKNDPVKPFDIKLRPEAEEGIISANVLSLRLQARTDSAGIYRVCAVPRRGFDARVSVLVDTTESDNLDIRLDARLHRRDLRVPVIPGAIRGSVAGQLVDRMGSGVPYAHVSIAGAGETRTDDSGRFVLRGVEAGTRSLEVQSVGMSPVRSTVDVPSGDSVFTTIAVNRVPMLGAMNIRAAGLGRVLAAEFSSRRLLGLGYIVDSTIIARYNTVENVMRDVPGLLVQRKGVDVTMFLPDGRGGVCEPTMYLDGVAAAAGHLFDLTTREAVGLEVYVQPLTVPTAYMRPGGDRRCGAILVWTKYGFKNR